LPGDPDQRSRPPCSHTWRVAPRHAYVYMRGDPCLSPLDYGHASVGKPQRFCRAVSSSLDYPNRRGMRPLRRGFPKSMAATHTLVAWCASRLPSPKPNSREATRRERWVASRTALGRGAAHVSAAPGNVLIYGVCSYACCSSSLSDREILMRAWTS
jgi:hypothetical protein